MSLDLLGGLLIGIGLGCFIWRGYWIEEGARLERRRNIREQLRARQAPNVTQMPEHREGA